jgi:hypothetical protein
MTDRELMQMALDALLWVDEEQRIFSQRESIRRLRDRLAQPDREWVGLTDVDFDALFLNEDGVRFARYIEAKLKEKNT